MATINDLPASAKLLNNSQSNGPITGGWDSNTGRWEALNWLVPLEDLDTFLTVVGGSSSTYGSGTTSSTVRLIPLVHPRYSKLYAQSLSYKFAGMDGNVSVTRPNTHAIVTVKFSIPTYNLEGQNPFQTVTQNAAAQVITVPGSYFSFPSGEKVKTGVGISVATVGISVTLHQLPSLSAAVSILLPCLGKVNSTDIKLKDVTYTSGTLLFESYGSVQQNMAAGAIAQEVTYNLLWRAHSWQDAIQSDGTWGTLDPLPYEATDMSVLFY